MKKSFTLAFFFLTLIICTVIGFLIANPFSNTLEASTINQLETLKKLEITTQNMSTQISNLETQLNEYQTCLKTLQSRVSEIETETTQVETFLVDYYIDKLKDPTYISIYNHDYIYYTAAENLGQIGKAAIPKLINKVNTPDDYERALVLYSLLLASQDDSVQSFAKNDYIQTSLDFDARNHPADVEIAQKWWNKYKSHFS